MDNNINNNNLNNKITESMLTTTDNPFSPFEQFTEWFAYDTNRGYNTLNYLARIALTSEELSENDYSLAIEEAMDEIIKINPLGIYLKVTKEEFRNRTSLIKNELLV